MTLTSSTDEVQLRLLETDSEVPRRYFAHANPTATTPHAITRPQPVIPILTPPICTQIHCTIAEHATAQICPEHHCTPEEHAALLAPCNLTHISPATTTAIEQTQHTRTLDLVSAATSLTTEESVWLAFIALERTYRHAGTMSQNTRISSLVININMEIANPRHTQLISTNVEDQDDLTVPQIIFGLRQASQLPTIDHLAMYTAYRRFHTLTQQNEFLANQQHACRFPFCLWNEFAPHRAQPTPDDSQGSAYAFFDNRMQSLLSSLTNRPESVVPAILRQLTERRDRNKVLSTNFMSMESYITTLRT
jgi:hypothetical protein